MCRYMCVYMYVNKHTFVPSPLPWGHCVPPPKLAKKRTSRAVERGFGQFIPRSETLAVCETTKPQFLHSPLWSEDELFKHLVNTATVPVKCYLQNKITKQASDILCKQYSVLQKINQETSGYFVTWYLDWCFKHLPQNKNFSFFYLKHTQKRSVTQFSLE